MKLAWLMAIAACGASGGNATHFAATPAATTQDAQVTVAVRTSPEQPPVRGIVDCDVFLTRADGTPLTGATLAVQPWMPSHDHGASVSPTVSETGGGHYLIAEADLFMPGTWQLRLTLSGAVSDTIAVDLPVQ